MSTKQDVGGLSLPKGDYIYGWRTKLWYIQKELFLLSKHIKDKNKFDFNDNNVEQANFRLNIAIVEIGTAVNQLFLAEGKMEPDWSENIENNIASSMKEIKIDARYIAMLVQQKLKRPIDGLGDIVESEVLKYEVEHITHHLAMLVDAIDKINT